MKALIAKIMCVLLVGTTVLNSAQTEIPIKAEFKECVNCIAGMPKQVFEYVSENVKDTYELYNQYRSAQKVAHQIINEKAKELYAVKEEYADINAGCKLVKSGLAMMGCLTIPLAGLVLLCNRALNNDVDGVIAGYLLYLGGFALSEAHYCNAKMHFQHMKNFVKKMKLMRVEEVKN